MFRKHHGVVLKFGGGGCTMPSWASLSKSMSYMLQKYQNERRVDVKYEFEKREIKQTEMMNYTLENNQ